MRKLLWLPLLLAGAASGEQTADRAQIASVIAALNQTPEAVRLFAADFDSAKVLDDLRAAKPTVAISHEPWGEATWSLEPVRPKFTSGQVRFLTPDIALVDGASDHDGKESPLLFVMKKEGDSWKIASIRLLSAPATH